MSFGFLYDSVLTWLYMWLSFQLFVCALNSLFAISICVLSPITKKGEFESIWARGC